MNNFHLTFDPMEKTYDNLFLINRFNAEHPWIKAYIDNINDKDYLELHYSALSLKDEREVVDTFGYMLNNLLREDTLKLLQPIITSGKETN